MRLQSIILIIQATDWYVIRHTPCRGTAVVTGHANTHTHTYRKKKHNFSSWPFCCMCANMLSLAHTPKTKKQCMCNAKWWFCTKLIRGLKYLELLCVIVSHPQKMCVCVHTCICVCKCVDPSGTCAYLKRCEGEMCTLHWKLCSILDWTEWAEWYGEILITVLLEIFPDVPKNCNTCQ